MTTVVIVNPRAAAGRAGALLAAHETELAKHFGALSIRPTAGPRDATTITRAALAEGAKRILVVGGDGTLNEVVNGYFDAEGRAASAELVCFPGGTGGDFVRSIGLTGASFAATLTSATPRPIDVGKATYQRPDGVTESRYFINISSFGGSGMIVDRVNRGAKRLGGRASFFVGTVSGLLAYHNQPVELCVDGELLPPMVINTVAVANGRYFGGSMLIAPEARLDDGLLDITIIGDVGLMTFLRNAPRLYRGALADLPFVRSLRGRRIEARPLAATPVLIDLDGEQPGHLPVCYEILPQALTLLAPWAQASA